jgi:hypothetical protein
MGSAEIQEGAMKRIFRRIRIFLGELFDMRLHRIRKILRQRGGHKAYERFMLSVFEGRKGELLDYLKNHPNAGRIGNDLHCL